MKNEVMARNGVKLTLGIKKLYVDGMLTTDDTKNYRFKTIHSAVEAAVNGTEDEPTIIYIEPGVYQMNGTLTDRGLYVNKDWIEFIGLTDKPQEVVIADNRGHTIGTNSAAGSSPAETIYITGTGFHAENLTIGNYCNVDLIYSGDETKNQPKRSSTITQAYCIGAGSTVKTLDKFYFKNVRFISMLDTLALGSVQRVYFEKCYIQGTDDYMGGGSIHVMKDSTLHCYSSKPVYAAGKEGMAFINCTWEVDFTDAEDLTIAKISSTIYMINCRFIDLNNKLKSVRWASYPSSNIKCYAYDITMNNKPYTILPKENTTEISKSQLKAYSVYNFLKGFDDWDPANEKSVCAAFSDLPLNISITRSAAVRTGEDTARITAAVYPETSRQNINWSLSNKNASVISNEGKSIIVEGRNNEEKAIDVIVTASTDNDISNQCIVTVYPSFVDAPRFIKAPVLTEPKDGYISLEYKLDLSYSKGNREDEPVITWYRCEDENGKSPIETAVSRFNRPLNLYCLTSGDIDHYIMACIIPKHVRSRDGKAIKTISRAINSNDLKGEDLEKYNYSTDFRNFSTEWQPRLLNGTWTIDAYYPLDQYVEWTAAKDNPWDYAVGINGAANGFGLLTNGRGAGLLYTQDGSFGNMEVQLAVNPEKTAAQGFGSANGQYLEIYIKYDTRTKTGYGLRIERTTKYSFATDFTLYEYVRNIGKPISQSVSASAFNPECSINLKVQNNIFTAEASSTAVQSSEQIKAGISEKVFLSAKITGNQYGGTGVQHTGTVGPGGKVQLKTFYILYNI